jgi:hypothetical protein
MKMAKNATDTITRANLPDLAPQDSKKNIIGESNLIAQKLTAKAVISYSIPRGPMIEQTMHIAIVN